MIIWQGALKLIVNDSSFHWWLFEIIVNVPRVGIKHLKMLWMQLNLFSINFNKYAEKIKDAKRSF